MELGFFSQLFPELALVGWDLGGHRDRNDGVKIATVTVASGQTFAADAELLSGTGPGRHPQ